MDVGEWLRGLGLEQYETAFREAEVGADVLPDLTDADLVELGVSLGNRKRLLKAVAALRGPAPQVPDEAERRQLTVMFCDLVGSTEISARLDPEDMRDVIRAYQDACSGVIARYDGFVARFMGDGILAYFGFPRAHEDEAERAIRSGLDIAEAVAKLETAARRKLAVRVGIATGIVVVGDLIGQGPAQERDVVGETPNLAARLQGLAAPGTVVIAESTMRLVGRTFDLQPLGVHTLKGFETPVPIWSVLRDARTSTRFEAFRSQGLSPMVNRESETALLRDRWRRARNGEGQVVLVFGEAGIGKSRIVAALTEHAAASPHVAISYQCSPHHVNEALYPILSEIRRTAGLVGDEPASTKLDKLEAMITRFGLSAGEFAPLLAGALSIPTAGRYPALDLTPAEQKERTIVALVLLIAARARRTPALALLEDAHWIDPTSLVVLGRFFEQMPALSALMVITARPEFNPPWDAGPNLSIVQLAPLPREEATDMVRGVAGGKALPAAILDEIIVKTDGVPLFVEELTKTVMESGLLREEGDSYQLVSARTPIAIPSTLQDSLLARLDRLNSVKDIAQIGAAIGREFSHSLLEEVAAIPDRALVDALDKLIAANIIHRRGDPPEAVYTFKHALLRDAAYQLMIRGRRRDVHRGIVDVLESRFPQIVEAQPEIAAMHHEHGGNPARAADYYRLAGGRAAARSANVEALAYLNDGLRVIESLPSGAERDRLELQVQLQRAGALRSTKGYSAPETGDAIRRAHALSQSVGEPSQLLLTLAGLYAYHLVRSETIRAKEIAAELLALARQQGDTNYIMIGLRSTGCVQFQLGHQLAALDHFEQSLALYDPVTHGPLAPSFGLDHKEVAASFRSTTLWLLGRPVQAEASQQEALSHAEDLKHLPSICQALIYSALLRVLARDHPGVIESATQGRHLARRLSFDLMEHGASFFLAAARRGQAAPEDLLPEMLNAANLWWGTGARQYQGYVLTVIAETYLDAGQPDEGLAVVAQAKELLEATDERWAEPELYRVEGMLLLALPERRIADGEACLRRAIAVARDHAALSWELRAAVDLARLLAELGRAGEGKALVDGVYRRFEEGFDSVDLAAARAILAPHVSPA
ncbi:adenylate/guanylate cyclase domain-containing protein [Bradyrhizobium ivorense]|uniref:adenylate/guanylate cyclase domain-containing protein n=1 Tax=Bradyrhizobium ivorense TaxID=2511166 RepID=UPI0010B9C33B|nr:adenylate/guanylate cyclase domain-containing protein [Bradyrhizobium ivorense]VIO78634.1 Adenylate cyclase 2 [Bradyrhizobium ivorense]